MGEINLLAETIAVLRDNGKRESDVLWVGSKDGEYAISWEEFVEIAKDVNYNNGFGSQEIAEDLVVVGKNWWLERAEYDGSEWWEYKEKPKKSRRPKKFRRVKTKWITGWIYLSELNR